MKNADMPITLLRSNGGGIAKTLDCQEYIGLTKREYFAGLALLGMLAGPHADADCGIDGLAHDAVLAADKLLKYLEK
tara:strand:- start:70507 stop:70737 length:231 start_codon:yes stop_codon:yes gene_type:complete